MECAYSIDYEDVIDPEKACELYQEKIITDRSSFLCPDCGIPVTCINIDKYQKICKVNPHFRKLEDHIAGCCFEEKTCKSSAETGKARVKRIVNNDNDVFLTERPQRSFQKKTNSNAKSIDNAFQACRNRLLGGNSPTRYSEYYTIASLVSKFETYTEQGTLSNHSIFIKTFENAYSDLFIKITGQDIGALSQYARIYYGNAIVTEHDSGYRIGYRNQIILNGNMVRPSIFISHDVLAKHVRGPHWRNQLDDLARSANEILCYVYSKPRISKDKFINFSLINLDYLDLREA